MNTLKNKLWLLRPCGWENSSACINIPNPIDGQPAWDPWYDKAFGMVVRAETEEGARKLANTAGGVEKGPIEDDPYRTGGDPWLDGTQSTCVELMPDGPSEVVIRDHRSA
ncbi:MAG TPA: hypothetical protein VNV15_06415 [Opitutaceae bacterium]|jgi:hypothetical protein|nr:hypothetical protein [Opitutaceae bacterium]